MGRPKGSKNKIKVDSTPVEATDKKVVTESGEPSVDVSPQFEDDSISFGHEEREKIYDNFAQTRNDEQDVFSMTETMETESPSDNGETVEETEETTEIQETEKPIEEVTEVEEPIIEETKIETKEERTVPYGALKEEREKRKERDRQIDELISDNKKLLEKLSSNSDETYDDTDEVSVLRKEIQELKAQNEEIVQYTQQEKQSKVQTETDKILTNLDAKLAKEGFSGLKKYGQGIIHQRLLEMNAEEAGLGDAHNTPEGWAKIWKKEYPKMAGIFRTKQEEQTIADKEALKESSNLASTRKKAEGIDKKPATRENNFAEYKKLREGSNVF